MKPAQTRMLVPPALRDLLEGFDRGAPVLERCGWFGPLPPASPLGPPLRTSAGSPVGPE
jgi:hypothetical protein